jgi:hypothetical protein
LDFFSIFLQLNPHSDLEKNNQISLFFELVLRKADNVLKGYSWLNLHFSSTVTPSKVHWLKGKAA